MKVKFVQTSREDLMNLITDENCEFLDNFPVTNNVLADASIDDLCSYARQENIKELIVSTNLGKNVLGKIVVLDSPCLSGVAYYEAV